MIIKVEKLIIYMKILIKLKIEEEYKAKGKNKSLYDGGFILSAILWKKSS